ncbi:hypothetical protein MHK_000892 [Candidatus Magnetomorum sp. HK-1]|nr:hypothetical protein MHK_000892 [Candidatus Magnetomorum sp. HK-1]
MHERDVNTLSYELFEFINSGQKGRLDFNTPIIANEQTLSSIYKNPHPDLMASIRQCSNAFIRSIYPYGLHMDQIHIPVAIIGLALCVYNCMALKKTQNEDKPDPAFDFTQALIQTLPTADDLSTALCYHSIINIAAPQSRYFDSLQKHLFTQCINLNALSQMALINISMPYDLYELACELLPEFKKPDMASNEKTNHKWINRIETLLNDTHMYRWIIHQWINLPHCLETSRNTGLVMETIRRRGKHQHFILDFYESCIYYHKKASSAYDLYSALNDTKTLLSSPGANKASRKLNLKGQEYFLQFIPLLEMTIEQKAIPSRSKKLFKEIASIFKGAQNLYKYIPDTGGHKIQFNPPEFEQEVCHV